MLVRLYFVYGAIVVAAMGAAQFQGRRFFPLINQGRTTPKSVRDNPGSYRPVYGPWGHLTGGK